MDEGLGILQLETGALVVSGDITQCNNSSSTFIHTGDRKNNVIFE